MINSCLRFIRKILWIKLHQPSKQYLRNRTHFHIYQLFFYSCCKNKQSELIRIWKLNKHIVKRWIIGQQNSHVFTQDYKYLPNHMSGIQVPSFLSRIKTRLIYQWLHLLEIQHSHCMYAGIKKKVTSSASKIAAHYASGIKQTITSQVTISEIKCLPLMSHVPFKTNIDPSCLRQLL